ncbi:MAG: hypothetical protein JWN79_1248 [Gemmatimonadetes bacterium]|jgi:hypothetical protein|nr:hypothetical protein [Gemmatimonadota bacterium]
MKTALLLAMALLPSTAAAQRVTVRDRGTGHAAALVDSATAAPYVVRTGIGPLVLPRDSTVTTSLIVLNRPTYVASHVRGDVVVVGADLFLRPGSDISGRAVSIGGTVAETTLGRVGGGVRSLRDETVIMERDFDTEGYALSIRNLRVEDGAPRMIRPSGLYGIRVPRYDRVDGLSLPVGVQAGLLSERVIIEPSLTWRSRLGKWDPAVAVRVGGEDSTRFEGRVARDTRSNDVWITSELINSLKTFAFGTDTRNYFRSDIAEGRGFLRAGGERANIEPFVGVRVERVSPVTSVGNVFSILGRNSDEKMRRPNPLVETGTIGSALVGAVYESLPKDAPVVTRLALQAEQSITTPAGTTNFTQLTADGGLEFPTFSTQRLRFRGHAVATLGDSVPRARYAYLGGSRTLALSDLLQFGGDRLVFVESRYLLPVAALPLPKVGPPTLSLIHRIGGAGVRGLGPLQQEVGVGIGVGSFGAGIDLEFITGASGQGQTELGFSISLPSF